MNIFADYHHGELYHSLHLLFEKRLRHNLYCPVGMDWFHNGYWKIATPYGDALDTVGQFLDHGPGILERIEDGIYYLYEPVRNAHYKGITFDKFNEIDIDIVISSIPAHDITFSKLIKKPTTKHISQMGNLWTETHVKNVMCSFPQSLINIQSDQNVVFYNQEFDLNIFKYVSPLNNNKMITSFVHSLPRAELFHKYKNRLNEFLFKSYGAGCIDGCIDLRDIASEMQKSTFGWHVKPGGDGYGHLFHDWLACGRPIITYLSDYNHYSNLLIPDETCIDLNTHSFEENVKMIEEYSEPDTHKRMCEQTYNVFKANVNFDKDAEKVKAFLEVLK